MDDSSNGKNRQFKWGTHALDVLKDVDLAGKTFAITGTTSGIGIETARSLALKGAHVVMLNRNIKMSEDLKNSILAEKPDAVIDIIICDLSSFQSVSSAATQYLEKRWPLHCLILNAGIMGPTNKMTIDNNEAHLQINHLSHYLLVRKLLPVLRATAPSRIVVVTSSSNAHTGLKEEMSVFDKITRLCPKEANSVFYRLYAYSKMCNVLMAFKLHRDEFAQSKISVYAAHPGKVYTDVFRDFGFVAKFLMFASKPFSKDLSQGASTQVYCAAHPETAEISGRFWEDCFDDEKHLDSIIARDEQLQDALWKHSELLLEKWLKSE